MSTEHENGFSHLTFSQDETNDLDLDLPSHIDENPTPSELVKSNHRSVAWKYMTRTEDRNFATCNICKARLKVGKTGTTTSLNNHLKRHHDIYPEFIDKKRKQRRVSEQSNQREADNSITINEEINTSTNLKSSKTSKDQERKIETTKVSQTVPSNRPEMRQAAPEAPVPQVFPEMPGGVMQDTFELFSRYMTSILRQIPVAKSYSLQQQFINTAIKAKMDHEEQNTPRCNCLSSVPSSPANPVVNIEDEDNPISRKSKRKKNNPSVDQSTTMSRGTSPSPIKQEEVEDMDSDGCEETSTSIQLVMENCHSEIEVEEFKLHVESPFEVYDDSLKPMVEFTLPSPESPESESSHVQSFISCSDKKRPDTNLQNKPTEVARKQLHLTEFNTPSTAGSVVSSMSLPRLSSAPTSTHTTLTPCTRQIRQTTLTTSSFLPSMSLPKLSPAPTSTFTTVTSHTQIPTVQIIRLPFSRAKNKNIICHKME